MNDLTMVQREFLNILEAYMHEKEYEFPQELSHWEGKGPGACGSFLEELYRLAAVHLMVPAVYETIRKDRLLDRQEYAGIAGAFKRQTIREVFLQTQRAEGFLDIYRKLCHAGIRPLVVKGIVCRSFYALSDYRVSSDEDMLLLPEDFPVCDNLLLENGFSRENVDTRALPHEIPYINRTNGVYLELHFSLFPESSGAYGHLNEEFRDVFSRCVSVEVQGTAVWTLHPTDHLFYLICHSFKHFLHGGFGIRQLCDMVMMAEHDGKEIDWDSIGEKLQRLHMDSFWAALAQTGRVWLGFDWGKAEYKQELQSADVGYEELLLDILNSGIYGDSSAARKHSSNITLAAAETGKKSTLHAMKKSLFPELDYMRRGYGFLERYPWLLPAAWAMRIGKYLVNRKSDRAASGEPSAELEIGRERVALLKKYRIIQ